MHSIYFARHGETVWNVENKICGMTDSPLNRKNGPSAGPGSWDRRSRKAASTSTRYCTRP